MIIKDGKAGGNALALSKQLANVSLEKNELLSKNEFLEKQMKNLTQKILLLQKKIEDTLSQKDDLKLTKVEFEYKLQKKKTKVEILKKENKEILHKLESYIDKDSENKKLIVKKNWDIEKDRVFLEENSKNHIEINEKIMQENILLNDEIKTLKEEIENLKKAIESMKKKLNDEFLKNKKNAKKILSFNQESYLRRSNTFEKNQEIAEIDSSKSLKIAAKPFDDKFPTEEKIISLENEGDLKKNSFEKNEFEFQPSEEMKEKKEISLTEKKKIFLNKSQSKKSAFSKQPSYKLIQHFSSKEQIEPKSNKIKKISIKHDAKKNITEKFEENPKESQISQALLLNKKTTPLFHEEMKIFRKIQTFNEENTIIHKKNYLKKYIDKLGLETVSEQINLLNVISKLSKYDQKSKVFKNVQKLFETKDLDLEQLLKFKQTQEKKLNLKETQPQSNLINSPFSFLKEVQINKLNNFQGGEKKPKTNKSLYTLTPERQTSKIFLKDNTSSEIPNAEDEFDQLLYLEFIKFKKDNSIDVLKQLLKSKIDVEKKNVLFPEKKMINQKIKSKSIPSILELNFMNQMEIRMPTNKNFLGLNFTKENLILNRKLKTENGFRNKKAMNEVVLFNSNSEKIKTFKRRNSNNNDAFTESYNKDVDKFVTNPIEYFEKSQLFQAFEKNEKFLPQENFSRNKSLFKYPFKSIHSKYENMERTEDLNYSVDAFEKIYKSLVAKHEKCGPYCDHLKRFYKRIRFVNRHLHKEELSLHKNLIDKINFPEDG